MNIRSIRAVARKEYYPSDSRLSAVYTLPLPFPLLLIFAFWLCAESMDVENMSRPVVVDLDKTPVSRELISSIECVQLAILRYSRPIYPELQGTYSRALDTQPGLYGHRDSYLMD